jgi:hypothetical protein
MKRTSTILTHSGYAVLFDPGAVSLLRPEEPDYETLEEGGRAGTLLYWPVSDEENTIQVVVDEAAPEPFVASGEVVGRSVLRVPLGTLYLTDPAYLHSADQPKVIPGKAGGRLKVDPGEYDATVLALDWPAEAYERAVIATVGATWVRVRDILGIASFLLALLTLIALPVVLIGRFLEYGIGGALFSLSYAAVALVPIWVIVVLLWRLPQLRNVDRVDRRVALRHPDTVVVLTRRPAD